MNLKNLLISLSLFCLPLQLFAIPKANETINNSSQNDLETIFWSEVNTYLESGNYLYAAQYLDQVVKGYDHYKNSPELVYRVADLFLNGPEELINHYYASFLLRQLKDSGYEKAVKAYKNFPFKEDEDLETQLSQCFAAAEAGDTEALFLKGIYYLEQGEEYLNQSIDCLKKAANSGNRNAQYTVGMIIYPYYHTPGLVWFFKASKQGHMESTLMATDMVSYGFYDEVPSDAMEWFKYMAAQNDDRGPYGKRYLAYCYWNGRCGEENPHEAIRLWKELIELGDVEAMVRMAELYEKGNYVEQDSAKALQYLTLAAQQGHSKAQLSLGCMGFDKEDYSEAIKWFEMALGSQDTPISQEAASYLGKCYENGFGVNQDLEKAISYYEQSGDEIKGNEIKAVKGDSQAQYMYAYNFRRIEDYPQALKWYRLSAERGNHLAMFELGNMYENGEGVYKDYNEAVRWYKKGADAGNGNALFALGLCYFNGTGVDNDYSQAFKLFDKAKNYNKTKAFALEEEIREFERTRLWKKAMLYLGKCYADGLGVKKNVNKAIECFKDGSEFGREGWEESELELGLLYYKIQNYDYAYPYLTEKANLGYAAAQTALSNCYRLGLGVGVDHFKAYQLLLKSEQQENPEAKMALEYFPFDTTSDLKKTLEQHKTKALNGDADSQCLWGWYCYKTDKAEGAKWFENAAKAGNAAGQYALGRHFAESDPEKAKELFLEILTKKELLEDAIRSNVLEAAGKAADELSGATFRLRE